MYMKTTRTETFRQYFIRVSKFISKRKEYNCYSSHIYYDFYDLFSKGINCNKIVKDKVYYYFNDIMKDKFENVSYFSLEHYNSYEFYFENRLRNLFEYYFSRFGISKKNSYFICTNLILFLKTNFLKNKK